MAEFTSYTRNNGFDPILIPDTTERDLRQQQRDLDQQRRAYQFGRDNRRAFLEQTKENQRLEADNRDRNFELQDTFIKQQRAAEKRNFDRRISNLQSEQSNAEELMKLASTFSASAKDYTNEAYKKKRDAERDFAYSLYYKYGVTTEERDALDSAETDLENLDKTVAPIIVDLQRRGATADEISAMRGLSGYAEYGANRAMVERAGRDFGAFSLNDNTQYLVNGRKQTLVGAISEGDELAVRTIISQQRTRYLNEAVPGMDPVFLDRYMFDSMRDYENGQAQSAQTNRLNALKAERSGQEMQLLQAQMGDPQRQGAAQWVQRLSDSPKGQFMVDFARQATMLDGAADGQPDSVIQFVDDILNSTTTNKTTGETGRFADVNPGLAGRLLQIKEKARGVRDQVLSRQYRGRQREEQKLLDTLKTDLYDAPSQQWDEVITQLRESKDPGKTRIANQLETYRNNTPVTGEAIRDDEVNRQWEREYNSGRPPSLADIQQKRDVSPSLKQKWIQKISPLDAIDENTFKVSDAAIEAKVRTALGLSVNDQAGETVPYAIEGARQYFREQFFAMYKKTGSVEESQAYAQQKLDKEFGPGGLFAITEPFGRGKGSVFGNFLPGAGGRMPTVQSDTAVRFEQSGFAPEKLELISKSELESILQQYGQTGVLPSSAAKLQYLADRTPKVNLYDVINGQIQYHQLQGVQNFEDVFSPPPIPENDLTESQVLLQNWRTARMMTDYMPNPTRSEVAQISLGQGGPALDMTPRQLAAIEAVSGVESGRWGYEAVNQGTDAYDNILGSGYLSDIPQHRGKKLVNLTVGEVMAIQDEGFVGSDAAWRAKGGVWAAGRYQFIPGTLRGLVERNNIDLNTKFSPRLQDWLFLKLLQESGPLAWEGVKGRPDLQAIMRDAMSEPLPPWVATESPPVTPWRVGDYISDEVSERYWQN